uniref:uncharacterized protein LOC122584899 n=1 Tax=Erigeron canadensis TaxID=72917 RepID=UPI001CB9AD20|nr:uncharacterized protein LOC122584899 [Erigeron canadensis]
MVQQTDSKFSEYVLANSETSFTKHDNKTSLRDLQNEVPKLDGGSLSKENGPDVKVSGIKRPQPESTMTSTCQQSSSTSSGPLVYVRRKTEPEQHKNSATDKANDQPSRLHENDGKNNGQNSVNDSTMLCIRNDISEPKTCGGMLSTVPLATLDSGKSNITSHVADSIRLQVDNSKGLGIHLWEERKIRLQNLLKVLDLSNQDEYCQMLRSLSSVGLSKVAVELEKRAIKLSVDEAKEVQRAKHMDMLDKFPTSR